MTPSPPAPASPSDGSVPSARGEAGGSTAPSTNSNDHPPNSNGDGGVATAAAAAEDAGSASPGGSGSSAAAITNNASIISNSNSRKLTATEAAIIDMMKKQNLRAQQQQQQYRGDSSGPTLLDAVGGGGGGRTHHAFWDTQPMPHGERNNHPEGPIEPDKSPEDIRQQPYAMPAGFEWSLVDVNDPNERTELYNLLAQNYVEDDDALFRFDYSPEFLIWALTPPGYDPSFIFGVRSKAPAAKAADAATAASGEASSARKLVAFISGVPATIRVNANTLKVVEINFLCVHKKLRSKRLAPVLIKEMTRRVNLAGMFQAVYTAGTVLPVPVSTARYHHRSLNPKKLVQVGFSRLSGKMTLGRLLKLYKLPDETSIPGLRPMTMDDVPGVHKLLEAYMTKFAMKIVFSEDEVAHWLLPRDRVVHSYVVDSRLAASVATAKAKKPAPPASSAAAEREEGAATESDVDVNSDSPNNITDLISFYHLPSSILKHNDTLYSVYSYYNVATSVSLVELMKDALVLAKRSNYDVFNALNLMDNDEFLEPLKFGLGDGHLQYYVYNWACPALPPSQVGIVLL